MTAAIPIVAAWLLLAGSAALAQEDLALKSRRAKEALEQRRFEEAIQVYTELVRALPENPGMVMNLGLALHAAGRYRAAIERFSAALRLQPSLTPAKILVGVGYQKLGEPKQAIPPLTEAIRAEPENRLALLELADAHLSLGHFDQALPHVLKLAELDPTSPKALQGIGLSYLGLSRKCFEELEKQAPTSPYLLALVGRSRAEQQQFSSAFYLYKQAVAGDGSLRGIHAALAGIYRQTGHEEWARVEEERERGLAPPDCSNDPQECEFLAGRHQTVVAIGTRLKDPRGLYWNALSYGELAVAAFEKLRQLPTSSELHELIGEAHRIQGRYKEAAAEFREALRLDPRNRRAEAALATALWRSLDYAAAQAILEKLVADGSAELHFQLGDCLLEQQDPERALPWLEKAVKLDPLLLPARASLGRAYLKVGRARDAIEHLKAALPIDEDGSLCYQLARAYERSGQPGLAKDALRRFQAISEANAARTKLRNQEWQITAP